MTRSYSTAANRHNNREQERVISTTPKLSIRRNPGGNSTENGVKNEVKKEEKSSVISNGGDGLGQNGQEIIDVKSQTSSSLSGIVEDAHDIVAKKREGIKKKNDGGSKGSKKFKTDGNKFFKQYKPKYRGDFYA